MIVVDSQGNEYEATYPKRAKGLVKSGRARFVGENKICLACPPNAYLEDNKMSDNVNTNVEQKNVELTKVEVWAQIVKLQDQLASLSETMNSIAEIRDTHEYEGGDQTKCVEDGIVFEKLNCMKDVFNKREETINSLLDFGYINNFVSTDRRGRRSLRSIINIKCLKILLLTIHPNCVIINL